MFIEISRKITKNKIYEYILLRRSYRDKNGKTAKQTIANLTNEPIEQVMALVNVFKGNATVDINNLKQGKTVGFSMLLFFIMKLLGITRVFDKSFASKVAQLLIIARVVLQSSRLQALYWSKRDFVLDIVGLNSYKKLNDKNIYLGLDYMHENKIKIEDKLFRAYYKDKLPKKFYYDVTSSFVEGDYKHSNLVAYGYNRDGKKGKRQIVIGLLTDENGHAISIDTYPGNTNDIKTFIDQLNRLKHRFGLKDITIVGDGGMIKNGDIGTIKDYGYDYITSIGKASINKLLSNKTIQMSLFDEELSEVTDEQKSIRYILRCNPIRAKEITENRQNKIENLKELIKDCSQYYNTHPKAKKETMIKKIDKKIHNLKLSSFISYEIEYKEGVCYDSNNNEKQKELVSITIEIDKDRLKEAQKLDGCYVIKTSLVDTAKDTKEEIHKSYKTLIKVENAFKTLKTDYLEIRPLYLKTDKRIKGHLFISMIAYNIVHKLKEHIQKTNFDFKDTIEQLKTVSTVKAELTKKITVDYIPAVNENLQKLFDSIGFKLPKKVIF